MLDAKVIPAEVMAKINALLDESTSEWNMQEKNIMYKALRDSSTGFNKNIRFTRNTTLMEGGPCCDFCFYMEEDYK